MFVKSIIFFLFCFSFSFSVLAQKECQFVPQRLANKWTIVDISGKKLTDQTFDSVFYFPGTKYILIQNNDKWGLLDSTMSITIPCDYDYPPWYTGSGILVVKEGKMGLLNEKGKLLIPIQHDYISILGNYYNHTIGKVVEDSLMTLAGILDQKAKKYKIQIRNYSTLEYLNRNSNQSINHFYPYFHYHIHEVEIKNQFFLVGNWRDSVYLSALYDSDGKLLIKEENLFIHKNFESVISYNGNEFKIFSINGKALLLKGTVKNQLAEMASKDYYFYKKYNYKDYEFTEGFYFLKDKDQKIHLVSLVDEKLNRITDLREMPFEIVKLNDNFYKVWAKGHSQEIYNSSGKKLYEITGGGIREPGYFNASFDEKSEYLIVNLNGKMALLNTSGLDEKLGWKKEIYISNFDDRFWKIKENDSSYYFYSTDSKVRKDKKWKWIFDLKMKSVENSRYHIYYQNKSGKWGIKNIEGKIIVPEGYEFFEGRLEAGFIVAKKDGKYGLIDSLGKIVIPFDWALINPKTFSNTTMPSSGKYFITYTEENACLFDLDAGKSLLNGFHDISYFNQGIFGLKKTHWNADTVFLFNLNEMKIIGYSIGEVDQKTLKNEYDWYFADNDDFSDGFMTIFNNNQWNIIDSIGNYLFENGFDFPVYYYPKENSIKTNVGDYSEKRAFYINGKLSEFFDSQIININLDSAHFSAIMRKHYNCNESEMGYYLVDENLQSRKLDSIKRIRGYSEFNRDFIVFETNNGQGLIDKFGKVLVLPVYSQIIGVFDFYSLSTDTSIVIYDPKNEKYLSEKLYPKGSSYWSDGSSVYNSAFSLALKNNRGFFGYNKVDLYNKNGKLIMENIIILHEISDDVFLIKENGNIFYYNINSGLRYTE